jgi:heterogeneous nuclear ribonucleoprotein Q
LKCHPSTGLVSHSDLDERAIEALKEFNEEGALQVLLEFKESDLSHVQVSGHCVTLN